MDCCPPKPRSSVDRWPRPTSSGPTPWARTPATYERFNAEARREYQRFASSSTAPWNGNFRALSASIMRMATLAEGGRITVDLVQEEIERLQSTWQPKQLHRTLDCMLLPDTLAGIDLFDRLQLDAVIQTCRSCATMAEGGRKLFAARALAAAQ